MPSRASERARMPSVSRAWALLGLGLAGFLVVSRRNIVKILQKRRKSEDFGAFIERFVIAPPPDASLPLAGLTFAVKDIFDIEGYITGFGNPDWSKTHEVSSCTSPVVTTLIQAGATCVGKTIMDELAYSINGENIHYGTPTNPAAPLRVPGGSSSGSAVAVAAKLVDFSLGTDTGGSVRIPASFCGIFGIRPSHSIVSTDNVIPMAQSFDTVGWFSRNPSILSKVGRVLLQHSEAEWKPHPVLIANDCFQLLNFPYDQIIQSIILGAKEFGCHISHVNIGNYISDNVPSLKLFEEERQGMENMIPSLWALSNAMRLLQRSEFKNNHGDWIKNVKPGIGPGISERVNQALATNDNDIDQCHAVKGEMHYAVDSLLKNHGVLVMPTAPGPPPEKCTEGIMLEEFRAKAFSLLSIAGLSGCCQVTMPLGTYDGFPVGVSFLASHGSDLFLLDTVEKMHCSFLGEN